MNLLKAGGTIGGLTLVSRILGFAREMVIRAGHGRLSRQAEVFIWAFQLPNLLRRLLGEGAFSQGFVPLVRAAHRQGRRPRRREALRRRSAGGLPAGADPDHRDLRDRHAGRRDRGGQRPLDERPGQIRVHGLPHPDHLPLSDLHQHGVAVQRDPQFSCRASSPQPSRRRCSTSRCSQRCCWCRTAASATAVAMAWAVARRRRPAARPVHCRDAPRRPASEAAAAANDAARQGAADPDPAGDDRRRRLLHQPASSTLISRPACPRAASSISARPTA